MEFIISTDRRAREVEAAVSVMKEHLDAYLEKAERLLWEASKSEGGTLRKFCDLMPELVELEYSVIED